MSGDAWAELTWRRRIKLKGPMPIEIARGDEIVGRLRPVKVRLASVSYEATWEDASWEFK